MTTGKTLRLLRTATGIGQAELAKAVGMTGSGMSLIEKGKREVSLKLMVAISSVLDVPLAALIYGVQNEEDEDPYFRQKFQQSLSDLSLRAASRKKSKT